MVLNSNLFDQPANILDIQDTVRSLINKSYTDNNNLGIGMYV